MFILFQRGHEMNNEIAKIRQKNYDLWKTVFFTVASGLIGVVTKSLRGVSLNFDGEIVSIIAIFYQEPTESEVEDFQSIEAEVISTHNYMSDLKLLHICENEVIADAVGNLGWVFLRKE